MPRVSITLSDTQKYFVECLAQREGVCATAFVYNLVVETIRDALKQGSIKNSEIVNDDVIEFVRSLISDDGVDLNNLHSVAKQVGIDGIKLRDTLGLND